MNESTGQEGPYLRHFSANEHFKPVKNDLLSQHLQPFPSVIIHILFNHDLLIVVRKSFSKYSVEIQT